MPETISIDENIKNITVTLGKLKEDMLRLEGSLRVFVELKSKGVENIEAP